MPDPRAARTRPDAEAIAIAGAGSIGTAFAFLFAAAGHRVRVFEPAAEQRAACVTRVREICEDLRSFGLYEGTTDGLLARIELHPDLAAAVADARYVQECAPEELELKRVLLADIDRLARPGAVIASSSSALLPSALTSHLRGASRCLVAHPGNPPYLLRVIELVPSPGTAAETIDAADDLLSGAGLAVVRLRGEIRGFVFNRLQGALLREAYCLVRDGIADVGDVDRIVRDGLGLRWAVTGPFETVDLNTRGGIASHAAKLGPAYEAMGAERGQHDPWTPELVRRVEAQRRAVLPLEQWAEGVRRRDRGILKLLAARRDD